MAETARHRPARERIHSLTARERDAFVRSHPRSRELYERARGSLFGGVPMSFSPDPPRNGGEAAASHDGELEDLLHLYALNRGVLITPFHNMALMAPTTTEEQIDRHTAVFEEALGELFE